MENAPQLVDAQWRNIAAMLLWKFKGLEEVTLAKEDVEGINTHFGAGGATVLAQWRENDVTFSLVSNETAAALAAKENG